MTQEQIKHWNLGRHYLSVGRHDRAIEELRSLLAIEPGFLPAHLSLVSALNKSGAKSLALEEATRLVASHPQSPEAHYWLSFLHSDRQIAQREIELALQLQPDAAYLHTQQAILHLRAPFPHSQKGRRLAQAAARRALELNPRSMQAHRVLGVALLQLNQVDQARLHILRALELEPENPRAHIILSALRNRENDAPGAEDALREALRLDPNDHNAQRDLQLQVWTERLFGSFADPAQPYNAGNPNSAAGKIYTSTFERLPPLWRLPAAIFGVILSMAALITIPSQWMRRGDGQTVVILLLLSVMMFFIFFIEPAARPWLARIPTKFLPRDLKKWGKTET